tara:strand:+ start:7297 stop:8499 length:1203 start_codon:yes stop_codon:yes gene_type:complete
MDKIEDIPQVADWLNQFEVPDKYLAEYMLKKIRYISFEEFEEWIQTEIHTLLSEFEKYDKTRKPSPVAIFPVTKPSDNTWKKEKEFKPENDSSGRIAHSLSNIKRNLAKHVEVSPRLESMRSNRVKHIIYVDDFIGTGDRFIKFWRTVPRTVKYWCAKGWCKIWVISFAAHKSGLNHINNRVRSVSLNSFRLKLDITSSFINDNDDLVKLCIKYGKKLTGDNSVIGYGKQFTPIIFQHGCPNNAPGILWCEGTKSKRTFKPLFSNRGIHQSLYPFFIRQMSLYNAAEDLWISKNYSLAVNLIENFSKFKNKHEILVLLGYLNAKKDKEKIRAVMVKSADEFTTLVNELTDYGLLNQYCEVTKFGKDVLSRANKFKSKKEVVKKSYQNFYPKSFLGFHREV